MSKPKKLKKIDELKLFCESGVTFNFQSFTRSYNVIDIESGRSYGNRKGYRTRRKNCLKDGYKAVELKILISGTRYQVCVGQQYKTNNGSLIFYSDEIIIYAIYQMKNGSFYRNIIAGNPNYIVKEEMDIICSTTN